jgi:hypothetical protein
MKILYTCLAIMVCHAALLAQKKKSKNELNIVQSINTIVTREDAQAHLTFLAADEMRGRNTPEIDIAANYLAAQFKQWGVQPAPGTNNTYFQQVPFEKASSATSITFSVDEQVFKLNDDIIQIAGTNLDFNGDVVFVGYGTRADFEKTNVSGKLVVAFTGTSQQAGNMRAAFTEATTKNLLTKEFGGVALIEIYALPGMPWQNIVSLLSTPRIRLRKETEGVPHFWMKNSETPTLTKLKESRTATASIKTSGAGITYFSGRNVAGIITGTDPVLKNEFLLVSAHYDHVGVRKRGNQPDSIYNGARDNAIGTVGLLETARFFTRYPQKRSVILLALTAEEVGLLGSAWYADHPLIPLNKTVFNFNCDGAGYNDTTTATVIGLERTTAEVAIQQACQAFGIQAIKDPVPEQNLFERSDNYNFAKKGIPAIDFAPGFKAFDAELMKYYHQPADEVSTLNFSYLEKYFQSYVYTNVMLANMPVSPTWKTGDKFEAEAKKLYGK